MSKNETVQTTPKKRIATSGRMVFGNLSLWFRSLLVLCILLTGLAIVFQVHGYRKSFTESQKLRVERKRLDMEWHKLLIEQQTFGATTQIGGRAVVTMGMYSPKSSEIITLNVSPDTLQQNEVQNANAQNADTDLNSQP